MILIVGVFVVLLPLVVVDTPCRRCRYDLAGLESENPTCPECGMAHAAIKVKRRVCRGCGVEMFVVRGDNPTCQKCGLAHSVRAIPVPRPSVVLPL